MKIERFEELDVWKEARELCVVIKEITSTEGFSKDFRFRDQIRASSGSIMDNIAEGFERDGRKEFIQFLSIAKGSCGETRSQCYRALDYSYISKETFDQLLDKSIKLSKRISSFITYLKNSEIKGTKYQ